jgi:hypothetical protein
MDTISQFGSRFQTLWLWCIQLFSRLLDRLPWLSRLVRWKPGSKENSLEVVVEKAKGEMLELMMSIAKQQEEDAHAAALDGTGPMPYDREWFEVGCDYQSLIEYADEIDWHIANDLLEVLGWALASPQGQRAIARRNDPLNPGADALNALLGLKEALTERVRNELIKHARKLDYSDALIDLLQDHLYA